MLAICALLGAAQTAAQRIGRPPTAPLATPRTRPACPQRRGRARPRVRLHPRRPLRSGGRRAAPRLRGGRARRRHAGTDRDVPPDEACDVLEATALWWQIQLDPEDRTLDNAFTASVERAIRTSEAWTERRPQRPRSLVLPRRRLRGAGAMAGPQEREDLRGARRQTDQAGARAGTRARPGPRRRVFRPRDVQGTTPTWRRRPQRSCGSCCSSPAAIARKA